MANLIDFTAILLDIDGTLIDSNGAHADTWTQALRQFGIPADVGLIRPLIGMGGDKLLPTAANVDPESIQGKAITQLKQQLFADRLPHLSPTSGARALVSHLRHLQRELIVATSADEREMNALLERAGVEDLIPRRASKDDAAQSKPDPDIVQAALARSRAPLERSVMVGDTPYDIEAARRAGIVTIALRCGGHWSDMDLQGAIAIFDDPAALLAHWK